MIGVHHKDLVTWENQPLKMTGSKSLGDTGFLQFLGLFQVIMANPDDKDPVINQSEFYGMSGC